MRKLAHAELHHITITALDRESPGGIVIAAPLLEAAGIAPLEEVHIVSRRNGQQLTTHVLPGADADVVVIRGGAASDFVIGHELDVVAFVLVDGATLRADGMTQRFVEAGPKNEVQRVHRRVVSLTAEGFTFKTVAEKVGRDHPLML